MYTYTTQGVCSKQINFEIKDNRITEINFIGGCPGNLLGISSLVKGMNIEEAIQRLKGISCGDKITSCPDQLAKALEELIANK